MSAASHRTRVVAVGLVLVLAAACGGERQGDPGTADTASVGSAPVTPPGTVAAVTPDTGSQMPAEKVTTTDAPKPGSSVARRSVGDTAAGASASRGSPRDTAPTPAAEPAAVPKPSPAPKPTAQAARDTQPAAPAARDTQRAAPPAPDAASGTDAGNGQDTGSAQAAAPAEQPAAPLRDQYHQAPRDTVVQAVYDGWKQYNLNCARCHGEDVLGSTIAPHLVVSLKPDGPINTKEAFIQVVCAGRPEKGMPAWCPLGMEMEKIEQIYAYVKGRSAGEIGPGRPALQEGS